MEEVQDSQPLMWIMISCIWEPAWFQQVKGLKAKRLEYGLVGERLLSMEEPWVSPLYHKGNTKRREEEGGGCSFLRPTE